MYFSQKPKIIQNCDDYNFKKMNLGPRTFKEAKKRKKSKNKRCSKPKTKAQVEKSFTMKEKYYLVLEYF